MSGSIVRARMSTVGCLGAASGVPAESSEKLLVLSMKQICTSSKPLRLRSLESHVVWRSLDSVENRRPLPEYTTVWTNVRDKRCGSIGSHLMWPQRVLLCLV